MAAALVAFAVPANAAVPEEMRPLGYFSFQRGCAPDDVECIVRDVWPDDLEERALAVIFGESPSGVVARTFADGRRCKEYGGDLRKTGPNGEIGPMQIFYEANRRFIKRLGYTKADLFDVRVNITVGYELYRQSKTGWRNWTCANRSWGRKG